MNNDVAERTAKLQALQVQIHQHRLAVDRWTCNAKSTKQHCDAALLLLTGHHLAQTLMDELLKTSTEAVLLRTTLYEQASGDLAMQIPQ